mgnify:CR=1 FL=1
MKYVKYVRWTLVVLYVGFILSQTIIGRAAQTEPIFKGLFWEVQNGMWSDIRLNILLFIPLGFLIGGWKGLVAGFGLSCGIELVQYFGRLGYCEMDDVLNNTIGAGIGAGLNVLIGKCVGEMGLRKWEDLPEFMKNDAVRPYWDVLNHKRGQLVLKRAFDLVVSIVLLIILAIPMAVISLMIKIEDPGPVLYRQERVTRYGKHFRIHKFRTMVVNADKIGTAVTVGEDPRITKVGRRLRRLRLDELPQVLDVIVGDMSFVGTRPEAVKYVERYRDDYYATLLMPAGITSEASIRYKDEDKLLNAADDVDRVYVEEVLPAKMKWNLESIMRFRFLREILTMFRTVFAVLRKDYE